jgi:hypothetical protein
VLAKHQMLKHFLKSILIKALVPDEHLFVLPIDKMVR